MMRMAAYSIGALFQAARDIVPISIGVAILRSDNLLFIAKGALIVFHLNFLLAEEGPFPIKGWLAVSPVSPPAAQWSTTPALWQLTITSQRELRAYRQIDRQDGWHLQPVLVDHDLIYCCDLWLGQIQSEVT